MVFILSDFFSIQITAVEVYVHLDYTVHTNLHAGI